MTYVMSDIHGDRTRFESIMSKIKLKPNDKLYILGDVIDRGEDGIGILLDIMKMDNTTVLLGNHELMMLNVIRREPKWNDIRLWYRNNGKVTHDAYMQLSDKQQADIRKLIYTMPLSVEVDVNDKKYILVHGAPPELQYLIRSTGVTEEEFVTWTRLGADDKMPEGKIVVFGHTPTDDYQKTIPLSIWYCADKIGIDCGCGHNSPACRLACLRLEDLQEFYSE